MEPNHVKSSDLMSILYSKLLRESKKSKFGIGDKVRISKYDLLFRKGYEPELTQEIFEIVDTATKKTSNIYNQRRTTRSYTWEKIVQEGTN